MNRYTPSLYHRNLKKKPVTETFSFFSTDLVPKYRVFWQHYAHQYIYLKKNSKNCKIFTI